MSAARILLVEDNPLNRELASALLSHAGHTVIEAEDVDRVLEIARRDDSRATEGDRRT